jgi:hypothetical protein
MKLRYLPLAIFLVLSGCTPKDANQVGGTATTPGGATANTPGAPGTNDKPLDSTAVPAALKHDGYQYYGLDNAKTLDVTLKAPDLPAETGGVAIEWQKVEDGKAHFKIARTGAIAEDLGDNTGMVDSTGVYLTGTSIGTISPEKFLALPADLTPGKTWSLKNKVAHNNGSEIAEDSVYKVEGIRDVKTKTGNQKALLVTSNGTANVSSPGQSPVKAKYTTKSWYVKGVGPVRIEISLTLPNMPPRTVLVEQS